MQSIEIDCFTTPEPMGIPRLSRQTWLLLLFGSFWAFTTGVFFSLPRLSPLVGIVGLLLAVFYAAMVCQFRQRAIWGATIVSGLLGMAVLFQESLLVGSVVAMTLALNGWIFGSLGIALLQKLKRQPAFLTLASLFAGSLALGWAVAIVFD